VTTPERDDRGPSEPGEREPRRLSQAPSARFAESPLTPKGDAGSRGSALTAPLARAFAVALAGSVLITVVGAVFASTFGLLFVAGLTGAAVGLLLARAAVPVDPSQAATPRRTVGWLAVGLTLAAIGTAAVFTWLFARQEGGTLGLVDYLLETFGPFVPAEAVIASIGAWWGASAGPVQS